MIPSLTLTIDQNFRSPLSDELLKEQAKRQKELEDQNIRQSQDMKKLELENKFLKEQFLEAVMKKDEMKYSIEALEMLRKRQE